MYVKDMKKIVTGMVTDVDNDSSTATIAAADTIAFNDVSVEGNVMKRITYDRFVTNLGTDIEIPKQVIVKSLIAANDTVGTVLIPAGAKLESIIIVNTVSNKAVTGGVNIGKTSLAKDVLLTEAVAGGADLIATPLITWFSSTTAQRLFISAETAWNSAILNVYFVYTQVTS